MLEYGPLKQDNQQGYTEEQIEELSNDALPPKPVQTIQRDGFSFDIVTDPTGRRVGECAGPEAKQIVTDALTRADAFISNDKVKAGKTLTLEGINDCITNVKASMTIVYPGGLPEWETVREILDGNEDLAGSAVRFIKPGVKRRSYSRSIVAVVGR